LKGAAGVAASAILAPAIAQTAYPNRTVRIVVPYPAGGTTDVIARIVAQGLGEQTGKTFVVENRPGAGGAVGSDHVAKSPADGHTLLVNNASFPFSSMVLEVASRPLFRFPADFASVTTLIQVPVVLLTNVDVPAKDLRDYVELLKRDRGLKHFYGSTGPGSFLHLVFEILKRETGVELEQVPYRGAAPMIQDLITGRIHIAGDQLPTSISNVRAGKVKAVATTASKRIALAPDIPTVAELGFGAIEIDSWNGLFAPAGTPPDILALLQREVAAVLARDEVRRRIVDMTAEPVGTAGAALDATIAGQIRRFRPIIEQLKIDPSS
jgi:tripartite-type tricarboxylate transporter receptor subunit TctC